MVSSVVLAVALREERAERASIGQVPRLGQKVFRWVREEVPGRAQWRKSHTRKIMCATPIRANSVMRKVFMRNTIKTHKHE